jgi:hypothetical protein
LIIFLGILAFIGGALFFLSNAVERGQGLRADTMQKSLSSHGLDVDKATALRVSDQCIPSGSLSAPSVSIVADFKGVTSVVTVMCKNNSEITELAAVPAIKH